MSYVKDIRVMDTLGRFSAFLARETILLSVVLFPVYLYIPFWKEVFSKKKEFAPRGNKFFLFRVDPFSEGKQEQFWLDTASYLSYTVGPLGELLKTFNLANL